MYQNRTRRKIEEDKLTIANLMVDVSLEVSRTPKLPHTQHSYSWTLMRQTADVHLDELRLTGNLLTDVNS